MRIHNIYADANGDSHIRDVDIDWAGSGATGKTSKPVNVSSVAFRVTDGDYDLDWHNAPRRQYIVNLEGSVEITTSDGKSRVIGPGDQQEATYVLGMDYANWQALHDGYDPQRTVMYRKILVEEGNILEFFKSIYFFTECLAVIGKVPAGFRALAVG